jgi:hypothetical protein
MNTSCTSGCDKPTTQNTNTRKSISECMFKMQDGRSFTDYRPRCTIQYQMKNENMKNSYESRMFLINNAEKMIKANQEIVEQQNACLSCQKNANGIDTFLPEKNMMKCDKHSCNFIENVNPTGLGTGRIYK